MLIKRCRKMNMEGVLLSPELTHVRLRIDVLMLVIKRDEYYMVSAWTILRKKTNIKMENINTNVHGRIFHFGD